MFTIQAAMGTMDFIIDTVLAVHPLAPLLSLLKLNGKLIIVGLLDKPLELPIFPLVLGKFQHEQILHCLKKEFVVLSLFLILCFVLHLGYDVNVRSLFNRGQTI